jgi:RNA polymerase sigma-70 factor (ECF subfamily)
MELEQEKYLIERVQKYGDSEAFGQLYDQYYQPILRFLLYRTGGDEDLAKDLSSETFFQALKSLWRFRWQSKPLSAWLYRIAHHQLMNYFKKNKAYCELTRAEAPDLIDKETALSEMIEREDESARLKQYGELHDALKNLSEKQHSILVMRYFSRKPLQEIADIMSLPLNTVKSHIHRALSRLSQLLSPKSSPAPVVFSEREDSSSNSRTYETYRTKT